MIKKDPPQATRRVVQAKLFIDAHFADAISLDHIAAKAHFSKFHFIRLFKSTYRVTPHQYLMVVRIEKAKVLLQAKVPVGTVCREVGFESVSSFTGLFNRLVKNTPSRYQQRFVSFRNEIMEAPFRYVPGCFAQRFFTAEKSNFEEPR